MNAKVEQFQQITIDSQLVNSVERAKLYSATVRNNIASWIRQELKDGARMSKAMDAEKTAVLRSHYLIY